VVEQLLLWLEIAAAVLLVQATLTVCMARFVVPEFRVLLYVLACVPGILAFGVLTAFVGHWRFTVRAEHFPFYYVATLGAVYVVGMVIVGRQGLRIVGEYGRAAAANWPLGKLAAAAAVAVVCQSTTLAIMDLAVRERIGRWKTEAAALALSVAPQRPAGGDNAAPLYFRALHNLRNDSAAKLESWLEPATDPGKLKVKDPLLRAFLDRHEADIQLLREAAGRPRCYFEHEYGRPRVDIWLPESQDMRFAAVVLSMHARVRAADGELATAAKDVSAIFACSRQVADEPFLISEVISAAIHSLGTQTLADVLSTKKLTEQQLAAFAVPADLEFTHLARRSLLFEEAMTLGSSVEMLADPLPGEASEVFGARNAPRTTKAAEGFRATLERPTPLAPQNRFLLPLYRVFLLPREVFVLRDRFAKLRHASMSLAEGIGGYKHFRDAVAGIDEEMGARRTGLLPPLVWQATTTDYLAELLVADTRTDLARLVLAAARYRAKNGKYPDRLDALVPLYIAAVPLDPFTDKPLELRRSDSSWTVFMKGTNPAGMPRELTLH
jgi:hypothetical protein